MLDFLIHMYIMQRQPFPEIIRERLPDIERCQDCSLSVLCIETYRYDVGFLALLSIMEILHFRCGFCCHSLSVETLSPV